VEKESAVGHDRARGNNPTSGGYSGGEEDDFEPEYVPNGTGNDSHAAAADLVSKALAYTPNGNGNTGQRHQQNPDGMEDGNFSAAAGNGNSNQLQQHMYDVDDQGQQQLLDVDVDPNEEEEEELLGGEGTTSSNTKLPYGTRIGHTGKRVRHPIWQFFGVCCWFPSC
jgi:hypothetical protein